MNIIMHHENNEHVNESVNIMYSNIEIEISYTHA